MDETHFTGDELESIQLLFLGVSFSLGMETSGGIMIVVMGYKVIATKQMQTFSASSDNRPAVLN